MRWWGWCAQIDEGLVPRAVLDEWNFADGGADYEIIALARYCTPGRFDLTLLSEDDWNRAVAIVEAQAFRRDFKPISVWDVPISKGTATGYPLKRIFTEREAFLASADRFKLMDDFRGNRGAVQGCNGLYWSVMAKIELLPREKIDKAASRLISYPDLRFTMLAGKFFYEQNNEMCSVPAIGPSERHWDRSTSIAAHFNRYCDFEAVVEKFRPYPFVIDVDWKRWDCHFRRPLMQVCKEMRLRHLSLDADDRSELDWVYESLMTRNVLLSDGTVYEMTDSEGSGSFNTYNDNSLGNCVLLHYALLHAGFSVGEFTVLVGGDDGLIGVMRNPERVRASLLEVSTKTGQELDDDRINVTTAERLNFFSMKPLLIFQPNDGWHWVPETVHPDKFLAAIVRSEKGVTEAVRIQKYQSFLNETVWTFQCRTVLAQVLRQLGVHDGLERATALYGLTTAALQPM